MAIAYSLAEIDDMIAKLLVNQRRYNDNMMLLKSEIDKIGGLWKSKETQTYEEFESKFNEKFPDLQKADELLQQFHDALLKKRKEIEDAEAESKASMR